MFERLKMIREYKKMSQADFAKLLGMGQSTLAMMEVGKRDILDRHIKTICSICHVNEEWLRHGIGKMINEDSNTLIEQLTDKYDLDVIDCKILESYLNLTQPKRKVIKEYLQSLVGVFDSEFSKEIEIEREVESYRRELEEEKRVETSSVLRDTKEV
jgi:transcriptional regulator with XRE-family HTH domain